MADELVKSASPVDKPEDRRIYGLVNAQVITNCDKTFTGRVKVRFSWLPGYEPWARVSTLMAGQDSGMFFIPQEGEEVLVAFNHGYINEPYVVGSLWNGHDKPNEKTGKDPVNQRAIRTPKGHEIKFDDATGTVVIKSAKGQYIVLGPDKIDIAFDEQNTTMITIKNDSLTLKAKQTITLEAPTIDIVGSDNISIHTRPGAKLGQTRIEINGGDYCSIDAAEIQIG
jgi:uncharacterized protein involved in type VI secretion and phage assembly